jgi:MSHA biogenesis protein MshJ
MNALIRTYRARFDALSERERVLVFIGIATTLGLVLYLLLIDPTVRESARVRERIKQQTQLLASTRESVYSLAQAQADPDAQLRARRDRLKLEADKLAGELEGAQRGLVPPERMGAVLEGLIGGGHGLKIAGLRSFAPAPLVDKPKSVTASGEVDDIGVFKHGIELKLEGSYRDLTAYVASLERMPWRVYWARAALDAAAYPRLALTLTLYTLSMERSWLRL